MLTQLRKQIRPTTFIESPRLSELLSLDLVLASETFQYTGSFKFRAAYNLASNVSQTELIASSSGNFGQALAYACKLLGKKCTVVMPATSAQVKIDAVMAYGGIVDLVETRSVSRAARVQELMDLNPQAYFASAYDDALVVEGNSSLAEEISERFPEADVVIAPVGGGGLTSGLVKGFSRLNSQTRVVGAEPAMANDAAISLREGYLYENEFEPQSLADGARTISLGKLNFQILREGIESIVEVEEETIARAVRLLFQYANTKSEPTGALSVGAILTQPELFMGRKVVCVISGGNVDPQTYKTLI